VTKPVIDVRAHGATGDGKHLDTKAIQRAVNEAARRHGTVRFPKGRYRSGTIRLRSRTVVELAAGATLVMSSDAGDFLPRERLPYVTGSDFETSDFQNSLLFGDGLRDIQILGPGTIDGARDRRFGPKPIALRRCKDVLISGLTIRRSPNYCVSLGGCDHVDVTGVKIRDAFADGIDPDCCTNVRVQHCDVESDDDAVVLKTSLILGMPVATENVRVEHCRLNSPSNGFKIGTETSGDVRNVTVTDCTVDGRPRKGADPQGLVLSQEGGGVAIESVDGAIVDGVTIKNTTVRDVDVPIFVRLGARGRGQTPGPVPGAVRNITIDGLHATGASDACTLSGIPGHAIQNVTIENVDVSVTPKTAPPNGAVPEAEADYPQAGMFGGLPATGVYARHVAGLVLHNFHVATTNADPRPKFFVDDVTGLDVNPPIL
jgi:polygalacturonase